MTWVACISLILHRKLSQLFKILTINGNRYLDVSELHQTPREVYGSGARAIQSVRLGKYLTGDHANITSDMILFIRAFAITLARAGQRANIQVYLSTRPRDALFVTMDSSTIIRAQYRSAASQLRGLTSRVSRVSRT